MSEIKEKTLKLIDGLKATCQSYGMGNDGNEYKIITQVFLYKFLNDKFGYELKNAKSDIAKKLTAGNCGPSDSATRQLYDFPPSLDWGSKERFFCVVQNSCNVCRLIPRSLKNRPIGKAR